jgi:hypothetical protein
VVPPVAAPVIDVPGAAGVATGGGGVGGVPYEGRESSVRSSANAFVWRVGWIRQILTPDARPLRRVPCRREVDGEGRSRPAEISGAGS